MLRMTWKVYACSKRMCSPGIHGEGELGMQPVNPGSPGKMTIKMECVWVCGCCFDSRYDVVRSKDRAGVRSGATVRLRVGPHCD